jgi:hypothetical protein
LMFTTGSAALRLFMPRCSDLTLTSSISTSPARTSLTGVIGGNEMIDSTGLVSHPLEIVLGAQGDGTDNYQEARSI